MAQLDQIRESSTSKMDGTSAGRARKKKEEELPRTVTAVD